MRSPIDSEVILSSRSIELRGGSVCNLSGLPKMRLLALLNLHATIKGLLG
jgi:hypothetical protein